MLELFHFLSEVIKRTRTNRLALQQNQRKSANENLLSKVEHVPHKEFWLPTGNVGPRKRIILARLLFYAIYSRTFIASATFNNQTHLSNQQLSSIYHSLSRPGQKESSILITHTINDIGASFASLKSRRSPPFPVFPRPFPFISFMSGR